MKTVFNFDAQTAKEATAVFMQGMQIKREFRTDKLLNVIIKNLFPNNLTYFNSL